MNILWGAMILIGILYGTMTGTLQEVTDAAIASSKEAVTLCITMAGVMSLWVGLMEIAKESGIIEGLTKKLRPFIHFLFPKIPEGHSAQEHIAVNIIANFLGLGWAATPAGLKAMEALGELEEERRNEADPGSAGTIWKNTDNMQKKCMFRAMPHGVASNEMCAFLILNISSLQLIPVNIIAYRSQYGSVNPTAIVGPGILATAVSTGVAVVFCKMMDRKNRRA
ncbi:MAG: nucleoside recognition protein [Eubacteriales bacterium]|nr:nucleoside recognition protein [Eubacteriales bacterium]